MQRKTDNETRVHTEHGKTVRLSSCIDIRLAAFCLFRRLFLFFCVIFFVRVIFFIFFFFIFFSFFSSSFLSSSPSISSSSSSSSSHHHYHLPVFSLFRTCTWQSRIKITGTCESGLTSRTLCSLTNRRLRAPASGATLMTFVQLISSTDGTALFAERRGKGKKKKKGNARRKNKNKQERVNKKRTTEGKGKQRRIIIRKIR